MSERKVLNKYYPPDFDPSKIPRSKRPRNKEFGVRLMAPCNMKCLTCGEYIAKAKKFNARKEDVEDKNYLGLRIYRFYIRCPGCLAEISFRTDPESTDYIIEAGAHRNFQALKLAEEKAAREEQEAREEIESNPMLLLENRTQQSQYEMEILESLEDLRELNERHAGIDLESMTDKYEQERNLSKEQQEERERLAALKALGYEEVEGKLIKRVSQDDFDESTKKKFKNSLDASTPSDFLTDSSITKPNTTNNSIKSKLSGLVKITKKNPNDTNNGDASKSLKDLRDETSSSNTKKTECKSNSSLTSALSLVSSYSNSSDSSSDGD